MVTLTLLFACSKQEPTPEPVPCDGLYEVWSPDFFVDDGAFSVGLRQDDPPALGENLFVVDVRNESDRPVSGASVTMTPTHIDTGEPTDPATFVGTQGDGPGLYELGPFELNTPGGWAFEVLVASGMDSRVLTMELCIE